MRIDAASSYAICQVVDILACALTLTAPRVPAQTRPKLADYYAEIPSHLFDAGYIARGIIASTVSEDLNGDGYQDLIVVGAYRPELGGTTWALQPGRVYLGDGNGHFAAAPANLFPVDTLLTVQPNKVQFADFNAAGLPDMFVQSSGWDAPPWPGEQNRLYLSLPEGGWRDATGNLPQISDFTASSAVGDISGRGLIDIFVGNSYGLEGQKSLPYTLLNTGSGQFAKMTSNIPAGRNELLGHDSGQPFTGATLTDLNDDGLPELILTVDSKGEVFANNPGKRLHSMILWNRAGVFVDADRTELPLPGIFSNTHVDRDVQRIDVNQDGLPDLVLVGTQGAPHYDGWFLQILVNQGNRQFVDETAVRVAQGEASGGIDGVPTNTRAGWSVRVLDFNHDGAPDFSMEFVGPGNLSPAQPLVWLNDGTGHFSTLMVEDFVSPGREGYLGNGSLVATRNGYSFIFPLTCEGSGGLRLKGMLASKPYFITPSRVGASSLSSAAAFCQ
jgi:hypothetical protein